MEDVKENSEESLVKRLIIVPCRELISAFSFKNRNTALTLMLYAQFLAYGLKWFHSQIGSLGYLYMLKVQILLC